MDSKSPDKPSFLVEHKFPGHAEPAAEPAPPPTAGGGRVFTRVVLPLSLFILIIGGIAWVTQYLPNWRERKPGLIQDNTTQPTKILHFPQRQTIWERDAKGENTGYVKEFERNVLGNADFFFSNTTDEPAELGLKHASCDCSSAEVHVSKNPWTKTPTLEDLQAKATLQKLAVDLTQGIEVPPRAYGFVRLSWKGRKQEGERLNLGLEMWMQPKGKASLRTMEFLHTPTIMVPAINIIPDRLFLGTVSDQPARGEFWCWSATRDAPEFAINPKLADPCFVYQLRPFDAKERQAFETKLKDNQINTRIRAAFLLTVTVYRERDGRYLDQGPFMRQVPLLLDDFPMETPGPIIQGTVGGNVEISSLDSLGKVNLKNFLASRGCTQKVLLSSPADVELFLHGQEPSFLEVKLARQEKGTGGRRTRWTLEIRVPPGQTPGALPEESVIILRSGAKPPRFIRIPLSGSAVQG